jgi:hypothetical protein
MTPIEVAVIVAAVLFVIAVVVLILKRRKTTPECVPDCENKCGGVDDGCGGACNGCSDGKNCLGTVCGIRPPCVPKCEGKCGEVWDGCIKRGVKGKCPKDCGNTDHVCGKDNLCRPKPPPPADPRNCTNNDYCTTNFAAKGLTLCDVWGNPSQGCVSPKCTDDSECYNPEQKYCSAEEKCVKDKCEAQLGPQWETIFNKCYPKCSNKDIPRSTTGWCMEKDEAGCPDGWDLKVVIANPSGLSRGNEVHSKACVPTTAGKQPYGWTATKNGVYVPDCSEDKKSHNIGKKGGVYIRAVVRMSMESLGLNTQIWVNICLSKITLITAGLHLFCRYYFLFIFYKIVKN